jgi:hypothetical protein
MKNYKGGNISKRRRSRKTRRSRRRRASGGGILGGVVSALKTALPSIVLYEALRRQGKRVNKKTRKGGKSRRRR